MIKPYNAHEAQGNAVLQVELRFLLPCHPNDLATFYIFFYYRFSSFSSNDEICTRSFTSLSRG